LRKPAAFADGESQQDCRAAQTAGWNIKANSVNLTAVYKGQTPDSVYLVPGDQVIVPGNTLKKLQTIMGFTQVLTLRICLEVDCSKSFRSFG